MSKLEIIALIRSMDRDRQKTGLGAPDQRQVKQI